MSRAERAAVLGAARPHERLAVFLASKEAVFKSLGAPWMGVSGFRNIRMISGGRNRFSFKLEGSLRRFRRRPAEPVYFSKKKHCILARCLP